MNTEEDVPEKSQIHREHMERVSIQKAAEEEALKFSRIIKGTDKKKYKNRKHVRSAKKELPDKMKLMITRRYQFLISFMGFVGVSMIFLGIGDSKLHWSIFENPIIELDLILLGCTLAMASVVGIIGFQHRHDKISDRIHAGRHTGIKRKNA